MAASARALLDGGATERAMASPEIPHNDAGVPIIEEPFRGKIVRVFPVETVEQLKEEFNIRGAGDADATVYADGRPGKITAPDKLREALELIHARGDFWSRATAYISLATTADAPPEEMREAYAVLRRGLRMVLWRDEFWPNNPGVGDDEIVEAVGRLMDERAAAQPDAAHDTLREALLAHENKVVDMTLACGEKLDHVYRMTAIVRQSREALLALAATADAPDMICESHPWLPWPHDECGGPGCPPSAAVGIMRQKVRALQIAVEAREAMIVSAYYATADAPPEVERITPNDEIVGRGWVHIERMGDDHIWMNILGESYDMKAAGNRIRWTAQSGWKALATASRRFTTIAACPKHPLSKAKARIAELEELLREGIEGFGRVLVQTSDQEGVNDWRRRARKVLDHE